MDTAEFIQEFNIASKSVNKISDALHKEGIINNPPYEFLRDKMVSLYITTGKALDKLRDKIKEEKYMNKRNKSK